MGLPPVLANITIAFSTITGNYSSVLASVKGLHGHKTQLMIIVPLSLIGSVLGVFGLFVIPGKVFGDLISFCIDAAGTILLMPRHPQQSKRRITVRKMTFGDSFLSQSLAIIGVFLVGIYAGFLMPEPGYWN